MRRLFVLVASLIAAVSIVACKPAEPPRLGKSPTRDVVAAMTKEEKVSLVVGAGMNLPGFDLGEDRKAPAVGETINGVPGAAGTTVPISRLGIPAIVLADGPAPLGVRYPGTDLMRRGQSRGWPASVIVEDSARTALSAIASWRRSKCRRDGRPGSSCRLSRDAGSAYRAPALRSCHCRPRASRPQAR